MPVPLRADFDAVGVLALAKKSKIGAQSRRLLAVAAIYDGASRTQAAKIAGVTLQIIRDWIVKFNASGPDGLIDRKAPGRAPRLSEEHRKALAAMIESGGSWRRALAHCRSQLLAVRGISRLGVQADLEKVFPRDIALKASRQPRRLGNLVRR
jgi:transposase